jgi:HSP20 family molecular chaperone IbpA
MGRGVERGYAFLWSEALALSERAERLHRRFLRYLGPAEETLAWEPPVDVHETEEGLVLFFALPGVAPQDIELRLSGGELTLSAIRPLPLVHPRAAIRRVEIPHGRFVRQVPLPEPSFEIAGTQYRNGCLQVHLIRRPRSE